MTNGLFDALNTAEGQLVVAEEGLRLDVRDAIVNVMEQQGVSRSELARRMQVSRSRVTDLLSNGGNPTVKTLARAFRALHMAAKVEASAEGIRIAIVAVTPSRPNTGPQQPPCADGAAR